MNATTFFTRRVLGMDYRVWGAMLLICFLSIGLYGFNQIKLSSVDDAICNMDTIRVNGQTAEFVATCYLDRYSSFEVPSEAAAIVEWDFKDGSKREKERIVSHKFTEEGIYMVTATINGRCELKVEVEVMYDPIDHANPVVEIYADPMRPVSGSPVKFYCVTDMASIATYEWKVLNTNEVKKDAVPAFTFPNEGNYTIQLMINGDPSYIIPKVITVSAEIPQMQKTADNSGLGMGMPSAIGPLGNLVPPGANTSNSHNDQQVNNGSGNNNQATIKPDSSKVSPPKVPELDPVAFKDLLQNVVDQDGKELEDLYVYLDYKASTMVEVNESGSLMPLKDFCRDMRNKKKNKRKIESLSFKIDDKKSIQTLRLKLQKSEGLWNKVKNRFKKD